MTGAELREWRTSVRMTQTELAARIGCGVRTVQDMESIGDAQLRTDQQLAVDMASMLLALEPERRSAAVLTLTALKVWFAVESVITPGDRARFDFAGVFVLSPHEQALVDAWASAMGRQPSQDQMRAFITNVRQKNRERVSGEQPTWNE